MAKKKSENGFIALMGHDSSADKSVAHRKNYDECVEVVHEFFLGYNFEIKDGKPYDAGNDSDDEDDNGFTCFEDVVMHNGKIAGFAHCGGDGPVAEIKESK